MAAKLRLDLLAVVALVGWLLWPIPWQPPLSQDHTVHLTRAYLLGQQLAQGHLSGWSSCWYFGSPTGELYPPLGDLAVVLVRAASLTLLPWPQAYAWVFFAAVCTIGIAMVQTSRALGWGSAPGLVAAAALLLDPGAPREGGFAFTVTFGVWLQPLSAALLWWALALWFRGLHRARTDVHGLVLGSGLAALALVTHPAALPTLALASLPLAWFAATAGQRVATAVRLGLALLCALALVGAWWLPLLAMRDAMANFGVLHRPLADMLHDAARGELFAHLSPALGYAGLGAMFVALWCRARAPFAAFAAVVAAALWLAASADFYTWLRPDRISEGFAALQWQRLLIGAKPGVMLCVGWAAAALVRAARRPTRPWRRRLATTTVAVACGVVTLDVARVARDGGVGTIARARAGESPEALAFERDWADALTWLRTQWQHRDGFYRIAYETVSRHGHGLADAPVFTDAPAYKIGYTPGETFVHRLDADEPTVLDRLRVRYLVTVTGRGGHEVARFGVIRVLERPLVAAIAELEGPGSLQITRDDPDGDGVELDIDGSGPDTALVFNLAGYPRWRLLHDGEEVAWHERAITRSHRPQLGYGDSARPDEPILLAAPAADGHWQLVYERWRGADIIGWLATITAALVLGAAWRSPHRAGAWLDARPSRVPPWAPAVLAAIAIAIAVRRQLAGRRDDADLASTRAWAGDVAIEALEFAMPRIDRAIVPALVLRSDHAARGSVTFDAITLPAILHGWVALADHDVLRARGHAELVLEVRGPTGDWRRLGTVPVRMNGGAVRFAIPTAPGGTDDPALATGGGPVVARAVLSATLQGTATIAFDLQLAPP
ncbi:MAG: hypothetical protein IPK74_19065 [Deltaproteobacteria bacterium]|nr:hypothetical protein [Deltaproteobacteria bacterium]